MRSFILKSLFFSLLLLPLWVYILYSADGRTDSFYLRFTSPQQKHLILGTSRAAQGLVPAVFREILAVDMYNYAFTIVHSPFGPAYYESIVRKVYPQTKDGVFILAVDPWSICSKRPHAPDDSTKFGEIANCVALTQVVDMSPNPYYLFYNYKGKYYKLLSETDTTSIVRDDGWVEIIADMSPHIVASTTANSLKKYRNEHLPAYQFSPLRLKYLQKTIDFLQTKGRVYLVRLPVCVEMAAIEGELMPDFDEKIRRLSEQTSTPYLDMHPQNAEHTYTDGNHLLASSARAVSARVADWIRQQSNPQ